MLFRICDRASWRGDSALLLAIAAVPLSLHLLCVGQYGYSRDELYYVACGEHLAWGYVDHPPFIALIAFLIEKALGTSLPAIRILPALAEAAVVFITGVMAREMGGGRFAQALAALAVAFGPIFLFSGHVLSMNAFDHLFWVLATLVLIRLLKHDRRRQWLLFGLVAGVGLLVKYSMGFLGAGLIVGLLLSSGRKHFQSGWLWLGGALAAVIFLPHVIWEIRNGFPTREFIAFAASAKIIPLSVFSFLKLVALSSNPVATPLWIAGLGFLLLSSRAQHFRPLGWMSLFVFVLLISTKSKPYYTAPALPLLFSAGAVAASDLIDRIRRAWLRPVVFSALALTNAILVPLFMPILPVESYLRYARVIGMEMPSGERNAVGRLPQHFADMFGWETLVATIARVYRDLPAEERGKCAIYTTNYGRAGSIDLFGTQYGLPKSICGHNSFFMWGPREYSGEIMLAVGVSPVDLRKTYDEVIVAAVVENEYCMPYENDLPIAICRKPKASLKTLWPQTKTYG